MSYKYIDISKYQGVVDFEKLKGNIDGVIIRAGYGKNAIDPYFERNISECNRLGIPCGVYWFSYALNKEMAQAEAQYCINAIKPYKVELPVCYDFEYDSVRWAKDQGVNITKQMATSFVKAFCDTVEDAGYYAMNYTNADYLNKYFDNSLSVYDLWYAAWSSNPNLDKPPRECGIWQYSEKGRVDGIKGNVDMNVSYKDYPAIMRKYGLNNIPKEEVKPAVGDTVKVKSNADVKFNYELELELTDIKTSGNFAVLSHNGEIIGVTKLDNITKVK